MSEGVRVESIDALKYFRIALIKFAEAANTALGDAESEAQATLRWLEGEMLSHWQTQIRKRHDLVERCKEAVRMKTLFKDASGRTPSAVEEEKALRLAQAKLAEAEQKLASVKKYTRVLQRELQTYKGTIQRFATTLQSDIPVAVATLGSLIESLEQYVSLAPAGELAADVASESTAPTSAASSEPTQPAPQAEPKPQQQQ